MNKNDAFRMGGCVSDRLGFDAAHRIGNQLAAMECAQEATRNTLKGSTSM